MSDWKTPAEEALKLFTVDFMTQRKIVTIVKEGKRLKLAMCDPADEATMNDIKRITGLRPSPCFTLENELETFWETRFLDLQSHEHAG